MLTIGALGFTAPWLLLALITLPVLWFLLRVVPPAPIKRRFPGVALLLGLTDDENETDKTPWWLLLMRLAAIAAAIIAFAGPVLNPKTEATGRGPLLVLFDGTWADAHDWPQRIERVEALLDEASRAGRSVALVTLTDPARDGLPFQPAASWRARLPSIEPAPYTPNPDDIASFADSFDTSFETFWLSDGLDYPWRADLLADLERQGAVSVFEGLRGPMGIEPARFEDGEILTSVVRARDTQAQTLTIAAHGLDPAGTPRRLVAADLDIPAGDTRAEIALVLPAELRNRITRFEIEGVRSAAAVSLTDDALRRREVALIAGLEAREGLQLLSPTHFLEQALLPTADLIDGTIEEIVLANPDVIVLADIAKIPAGDAEAILDWVEDGGLLVRFAGPRLASSDVSRDEEDALMPVRLRAGGRTVGGAMSWGEPKTLRAFTPDSPFFGLPVPDEVRVAAQVMAQPDPTLSERSIAALTDGTPLVTRKIAGQGQIVLFHVTANAEWSSLPLSGLFVEMLERLAISSRPAVPDAAELEGRIFVPDQILNGFGAIQEAGTQAGVPGENLIDPVLGPSLLPGLYAGPERRLALNVIGAETEMTPVTWPSNIPVEGLSFAQETGLKGAFLTAAILILLADIIASLFVAGRLTGARATAASLLLAVAMIQPAPSAAQSDAAALAATSEVVLAHVVTGNARLDDVAQAGLQGLSAVLFQRTSIEPAAPIAVNLETDELSFFPFLYWPVTADQPLPSDEAYAKLNRYLRTGGMILFD
ncbi:MAG: DUF4159 domain-containing protein, partial [Pseudomonadota bacterium]